MTKDPTSNHGEGNPEAAKRFNDAETRFVNSPRGQEKIREGAAVKPGEEPELTEAARRAKAHAKAQDSPQTWEQPPKA